MISVYPLIRLLRRCMSACVTAFMLTSLFAHAQTTEKVVDLPTRPGATQRILVLTPPQPKAAVILMTGGHGGLQISQTGVINIGKNNSLIRNRQLFADRGFLVIVVDAPSDLQSYPFISRFRLTAGHVTDVKAIIAWVREQTKTPVWLAGTSRGTQSAAYIATHLEPPDGPDGIAITSTILYDKDNGSVLSMPIEKLKIPVLVVHHQQDACKQTLFSDVPELMRRLADTPKSKLLTFSGGESHGDLCGPEAYHGYNGLDREVVDQMTSWMLANQ